MSGETAGSAANALAGCQWCGMLHGKLCPAVKAIEYHQNGAVKRVEFKTAVDYPPVAATDPRFGTAWRMGPIQNH